MPLDRRNNPDTSVSIVTPTLRRPQEVAELLENLSRQILLPVEVILVDGAPGEERETEKVVAAMRATLPFPLHYLRHGGGTAIQRNFGIDHASSAYITFLDDDIRLEPDFLQKMVEAFAQDSEGHVGGIVGYRTNEYFTADEALRWRWYRRLRLLTTYEPGRYDRKTGLPVNANLQAPFKGVRRVDFMTTSCAMWRREVLDSGLRFDTFFRDYGVLEDAHFSLRAGHDWQLLQCGDAHCLHLSSQRARTNRRKIGYKYVVNYYYVFQSIAGPLTWRQQARFWRFQAFELFRTLTSAIRRHRKSDLMELWGRLEGFRSVAGRRFSD